MNDPVNRLIDAIASGDADAIRAQYRDDSRLITMTPNTFMVADGPDAITARLSEWFFTWEENPAFSFLGTVRDGDRVAVEFERTSTYEGDDWVVRQAHMLQVGDGSILEHRIYCCGPRKGQPDLATQHAGSTS